MAEFDARLREGDVLRARVGAVIDAVRPAIREDGGDIELVSVSADVVRVRLAGACLHCAMAGQTLGGIRRRIQAELGVSLRVLPAAPEERGR